MVARSTQVLANSSKRSLPFDEQQRVLHEDLAVLLVLLVEETDVDAAGVVVEHRLEVRGPRLRNSSTTPAMATGLPPKKARPPSTPACGLSASR